MPSRLRFILPLFAAVIVLFAAGPSVNAQSDANLYQELVNRSPGPRIISVPQRIRAPARRVLQPSADAAALGAETERRPKVDPTSFIFVMGDTLGELLGAGLDDALGDVPTAAVIRRTRADSGLVRSDFHDWPRVAREVLATERVTAAVILLGANDRQPLREGELVHEPLSDRWRELYRDRIDALVQAFTERQVPLIWVGAPPMQNGRLTADLVTINEIFRQRVERAGAIYVDLWPGFVDAENRYSAIGPDLSGQMARLRTGDGVHFTRSGARKAAHFVDVPLRRALPDLGTGPALAGSSPLPPPVTGLDGIALPLELQPGGVEKMIDQMARLGTGLEPVLAPDIQVKPIAGPVLPLTGPAIASGGALVQTVRAARGSGAQAAELERIFTDGRAPAPLPGRADDFRWPRP